MRDHLYLHGFASDAITKGVAFAEHFARARDRDRRLNLRVPRPSLRLSAMLDVAGYAIGDDPAIARSSSAAPLGWADRRASPSAIAS